MVDNKKITDEQAEKVTGGNFFSNLWNKVKLTKVSDPNAIYGSTNTSPATPGTTFIPTVSDPDDKSVN